MKAEKEVIQNMSEVILDVREKDEFDAEHIPSSVHVPLSKFAAMAPGILQDLTERQIMIMCRSGNRARLAKAQISQLGYGDKVSAQVYEGGILEWSRKGNPTIIKKKGHLPIMRQVQLIAGAVVLATSIFGAFLNPWFLILTAFFGAGLTVAGATGFCGMASFLALMPWNRSNPGVQEELCTVSPSSPSCSS